MCVRKDTVLLVVLGRFLLCYYCFWAGRPKTPQSLTHLFIGWVICGVVVEDKHVCSKAYGAHDVAAAVLFLVLGLLLVLLGLVCGVVGEHTHVCAQGQCCWFCLGGFLCAVTVSGQVAKKHHNRLRIFLRGGSYVVLLVNTNMCVARHMMLMMLLQLPGFWSWAAVAVVVAVGLVLGCCCCCCCSWGWVLNCS